MFFISLIIFVISDCQDYKLPQASREMVKLVSKLKSTKSMKIFGKDTFPKFPKTSIFSSLKHYALNFAMGQIFPTLIVLILGFIAVIVALLLTVFVGICCLPTKSRMPGLCIIFWWIFFTLFFLVSMVYYVFAMIEAPKFIDDFPKIIDVIQEATHNIHNVYIEIVDKFYEAASNTFMEPETRHAFPSFFVLENGNWVTNDIKSIFDLFTISYNEKMPTITHNYPSIKRENYDMNLNDTLDVLGQLTDNLISVDGLTNYGKTFKRQYFSYMRLPTEFDYSFIMSTLSEYEDVFIPQASTSFSTDNIYYTLMKIFLYIVFALLVIFYIFETIAVFSRNSFSRCCAIASQPISFIIAIVIGVVGVVCTAIACSVSDVCVDSASFASEFYTRKVAYIKTGLPRINPTDIFDSTDKQLYQSLRINTKISFHSFVGNLPPLKFENIGNFEHLNNELTKSLNTNMIKEKTNRLITDLRNIRRQAVLSNQNVDDITELINHSYSLLSTLNYKIPLLTTAINQIPNDNEKHTIDFSQTPSRFNSIVENESLSSSLFTCPLRSSKKYFCEETGGTFSYLAVFSHFYLVSLIAFMVMLFIRRRNMVSMMVYKGDTNDTFEDNIETKDVTMTVSPNKNDAKWKSNYADNSLSESHSVTDSTQSSDSFEMCQQSRDGLF